MNIYYGKLVVHYKSTHAILFESHLIHDKKYEFLYWLNNEISFLEGN